MFEYLRRNLGAGLRTAPWSAPWQAWCPVPLFVAVALPVGFASGLLGLQPIDSGLAFILPPVLFVFPSLLEEAFFRGVLIPRDVLRAGAGKTALAILLSTAAFVIWHPLNALAFNHSAIPLFLDPWFLVIVAALGLA